MVSEQIVRAQAVAASSQPLVEEGFELRVERHVAVAVELADRHPKPVGRTDLHDGVDGQVDELAAPQAGAGQQLDTQPYKWIGVFPCGAEEFGGGRIVKEARQGFIEDGEVTTKEQHSRGSVIACPLHQADEHHVERSEITGDCAAAEQRRAAPTPSNCGSGCQVAFEGFDVAPTYVSEAADVGSADSQKA